MTQTIAACPVAHDRDERKSAAIAARNVKPNPGAHVVGDFIAARDILRSSEVLQAGAGAEHVSFDNPEHVSVFFLDGELHKKRRSQLARYFTPKAIKERHHVVMHATTQALIAQLRDKGSGQLDLMSMRLACDVAAEIVGLTSSDPEAMSERLRKVFFSLNSSNRNGAGGLFAKLHNIYRVMMFNFRDVIPAIRERRGAPKDDVISFCVQEGYSNKSVLIECMTYATAGMLTTREFIVMVAWHLLERDDLRDRFLSGGEDVQLAILDEILRLEPVAAMIHRKAIGDFTTTDGREIKSGELYAVDMRAANTDENAAGPCPFAIDPDRARREKVAGNWMSFAQGPHRCPGAQVALHETRIFVDALLRVPGIRLATAPQIGWCAPIMGYEVHGAIVECDRS